MPWFRRRSWLIGSGTALVVAVVVGAAIAGAPGGTSSAVEPPSSATILPSATATSDATSDAAVDPLDDASTPRSVLPRDNLGTGTDTPAAGTAPGGGTALALLATLAVKGKAPKTGYDRTGDFGTAWLDVDKNGCDTRNDILSRDLNEIVREGSCKVLNGVLAEPYTGTTIHFVRGHSTSSLVQIDHIVALMNAWQTGAQQLSAAQRVALANDPLNLLAVDGPSNSQKGAGDTATWLPASKSFRCQYVARQISVKASYGLWVAPAEHDAMVRVLDTCPDQKAGTPALAHVTTTTDDGAPGNTGQTKSPPPPLSDVADSDVSYKNCAAARAAGAAPVHEGDPGYSRKLDRDGDGIGCE